MDISTICQFRCRRCHQLRTGIETCLQIVLLYAAAFTVITAGEVPHFTQHPQSAIVEESTKVSLRCKVSPEDSTIRWLFNGQTIVSDSNTGIDIENGHLVIQSFTRSTTRDAGNEGTYQCVASNDDGKIVSLEGSLEATYIGDFFERSAQDHRIDVTEGNVAYIPCPPISGRPHPHVHFELNGTALDTTPDRYMVLPSGTLQIGNVHSRDRGLYRCLAENPISAVSKRAKRIVHLNVVTPITNHPPVFNLVPPQEVKVISGHSLMLECAVEGAPVPVITWSKYGGKLPENRYRQIFGNLELLDVGRLDEGTYICNAHNGIGPRQVAIAQVDVLEPASIQSGPTDQYVAMGTSATFQCQGRGKPVVTVEWFHNGKAVRTGSGIISINDTTLTINQVRPKHEGVYQCIVKNSLGGESSVAHLSITEDDGMNIHKNTQPTAEDKMQGIAPDMENVHPLITTLPQNTTINTGGATVLPCGTNQEHVEHGENFLWLRNSVAIERLTVDPHKLDMHGTSRRGSRGTILRSQLRVLPSGSLQILNAQPIDSGEYTCVLWIAGNSDSASAILTVLPLGDDGRETPGDRNRHRHTSTLAGATDHTPRPTLNNEGRRRGNNQESDDDILEISDEDEQTNKGGRRKSKNRNRGRTSAQESAGETENRGGDDDTDGELIPPSRPQVSKLSDTSVMLEWSIPENPGLAITFFKVQYKELVPDKQRRRWRTIDEDIQAHDRQFEVVALKPGSTYRFRIVGVYSNDDNKHSANSRKFTMEALSQPKVPLMGPVIVEARPLSQNAVALKWQYQPEKWTPLEGFIIYYHIYGSHTNPQTLTVVGSHIRETELEPLLPNTMYAIRMKGYNSGGESEFSNTVVQSTISPSDGSEFDYNFHVNGQPLPTNWPAVNPGGYKPTMETVPAADINPRSTEESSRMLYIVLGCVLGIMVLFLLFFMAMCAWKQRQRTHMLATIEGRNKFDDQSRAIYAQDSMRHKHMNGNGLLLNGLNTANGNGTLTNGHIPGYSHPHMNITANPMTDTEGQRSPTPHHHDNRDSTADNIQSLQELRASLQEMLQVPPPPPPLATSYDEDQPHNQHNSDNLDRYEVHMSTFGRNRSRHSQQIAGADHLYDQPPEYHSIGSRRSNIPDHRPSPQLSIRSQTSSSYRVHDPHLTDHIPRSHDRQHYRRPDVRGSITQAEPDHSSEHSHSSSSQVSAKHKRRRRKPAETDDHVMKDQATNTDNENTLPGNSQVHHRLRASPSDHLHHHSNQSHRHSNNHSHNPSASHHYGNSHLHDNSEHHPVMDEPHYGNQPCYHSDPSEQNIDQLVENCEGSSDERDYEIIADSSPPPSYQSPDHSRNHRDASHLHGNVQYSDSESLPEAPPTPPQLPRLPRLQDYPQTDPED